MPIIFNKPDSYKKGSKFEFKQPAGDSPESKATVHAFKMPSLYQDGSKIPNYSGMALNYKTPAPASQGTIQSQTYSAPVTNIMRVHEFMNKPENKKAVTKMAAASTGGIGSIWSKGRIMNELLGGLHPEVRAMMEPELKFNTTPEQFEGYAKEMGLQNIGKYWTSAPNVFTPEDYKNGGQMILYKKGGGIHIKKENVGKFTATVKKTHKSTAELAHSKNPLTKKRAIFAQNMRKLARKHKKLTGGLLHARQSPDTSK